MAPVNEAETAVVAFMSVLGLTALAAIGVFLCSR